MANKMVTMVARQTIMDKVEDRKPGTNGPLDKGEYRSVTIVGGAEFQCSEEDADRYEAMGLAREKEEPRASRADRKAQGDEPSRQPGEQLGEHLEDLKKEELEDIARQYSVDISRAKTKAEIADAIRASQKK